MVSRMTRFRAIGAPLVLGIAVLAVDARAVEGPHQDHRLRGPVLHGVR